MNREIDFIALWLKTPRVNAEMKPVRQRRTNSAKRNLKEQQKTASVSPRFFMKRAFELAEKGRGHTSPNPCVGCVIIKNGKIIAEGWHKKAGGPHAEIEALKIAGENARGATMYVSLEPCCHFGKTPPCTNAIIKAGIKRVIAAIKDPNPLVNGKGIRILRKAGIKTEIKNCP